MKFLEELPPVTRAIGARPEKYPYDEYLDGQVRAFYEGDEELKGSTLKSFENSVRTAAARRDLGVACRKTEDGGLAVQAREKAEPEPDPETAEQGAGF